MVVEVSTTESGVGVSDGTDMRVSGNELVASIVVVRRSFGEVSPPVVSTAAVLQKKLSDRQ